MRLKAPMLPIPEAEPFKHDKLSRANQVRALSQLIGMVDEPLVVSVSSPWGSGKTTLLWMLTVELKREGLHVVNINAWETDFTENALVSLLGELQSELQRHHVGDKKSLAALVKQVGKVGTALIDTALPFAVRIASGGLLSIPVDMKAPLSDFIAKVTEDQLRAYRESKTVVEKFKKTLEQALDHIATAPGKPLVIMIDELDRCKPTYSIQMLEAAKHFFDISHICFILALDDTQLLESIKGVYGSGLNASEYLRKLIDVRYELPRPDLEEYCKSLFERFDLSTYFQERTKVTPMRADSQEFLRSSIWLFKLYELSLRAQEQCFTQLCLVLKSTPHNQSIYPALLMLLLVFRDHDRQIYEKIVKMAVTPADVISHLKFRLQAQPVIEESMDLEFVEALFVLALSEGKDIIDGYRIIAKSETADKAGRARAEKILKVIEHYQFNFTPSRILQHLVHKMELLEQFTM